MQRTCTCTCTCTCICTYPAVSDRALGRHRRCNPLPPIYFVISFSYGVAKLQPCPFSDVVFPTLLLSAPSSPPCTVPCKIVLASPDDLDTCPNHFNLRFFTVVKISSWGPMACLILSLTASLVMWSLYEMPSSFRKHLISVAYNLYTQLQSCILYPTWSRRTANPEEKYRFCLFVFPLYYISAVIG